MIKKLIASTSSLIDIFINGKALAVVFTTAFTFDELVEIAGFHKDSKNLSIIWSCNDRCEFLDKHAILVIQTTTYVKVDCL